MNHTQFCGEYATELPSGKVTFSTARVKKFISVYTYLKYEDFTTEMIRRLRSVMIDYYNQGISKFGGPLERKDMPPNKIELPAFIFQ